MKTAKFKHLIQDGHLEEFDQLVTDTSHLTWTPVSDCPSTLLDVFKNKVS